MSDGSRIPHGAGSSSEYLHTCVFTRGTPLHEYVCTLALGITSSPVCFTLRVDVGLSLSPYLGSVVVVICHAFICRTH